MLAPRHLLLAATLIAGGCDYDPELPEQLACGVGGACPNGLVCDPAQHLCVAELEVDAGGDPPDDRLVLAEVEGPVRGCVDLIYDLADPAGRAADLRVTGEWETGRAELLVQGPSPPGSAGVRGVPSSPAGRRHAFRWSSRRQLPAELRDVTVRVRATFAPDDVVEKSIQLRVDNQPTWIVETSPTSGNDVALADLDGDGRLDRVVAGDDGVDVFLAGGDAAGPSHPLPAREVAVAELDGEPGPDLLVIDGDGLYLLPGGGERPSVEPQLLLPGEHLADLEATDIDGDGRDDVAVVDRELREIVVLRQAAGGPERVPVEPLPGRPTSLAVADFDGDSRKDLLVAYPFSGSISQVYRQTDEGGFASAARAFGLDLFVADGTGLGERQARADAVAYDEHHAGREISAAGLLHLHEARPHLVVWAHDDHEGDGPFVSLADEQRTVTFPVLPVRGLAIGDLDGDGLDDVITVGPVGTTILRTSLPGGCERGVATQLADSLAFLGSAFAELTGDGKEDRLRRGLRGGWELSPGLGNGSFADATPVALPDATVAGFLDADHDGRSEILFEGLDGLELWTGDGRGGFRRVATLAGVAPAWQVADVDRDGHADIVSGGGAILWGNGTLDFPPASSTGISGIALVADLDGDQRLDLVASSFVDGVELFVQAAGTPRVFGSPLAVAGSESFRPGAAVDVTGDGRADLVGVREGALVVFEQLAGPLGFAEVASERLLSPEGLAELADVSLFSVVARRRGASHDILAASYLLRQDEGLAGPLFLLERTPKGPCRPSFVDGDDVDDLACSEELQLSQGQRGPLVIDDVNADEAFVRFAAEQYASGIGAGVAVLAGDAQGLHHVDLEHPLSGSARLDVDARRMIFADVDRQRSPTGTPFLDELVLIGDGVAVAHYFGGFGWLEAEPVDLGERVVLDATLADLDRDGFLDLVLLHAGGVAVSHNLAGGFAPAVDLGVGAGADSIDAGLVDADSWPDLVLSDGPSLLLLHQRRDPPLEFDAPIAVEVPRRPRGRLLVLDLDGDDVNELIVPAAALDSGALVLRQAESGWQPLPESWMPEHGDATDVQLADLDGDGWRDLLVTNAEGVWLAFGEGAFAFAAASQVSGPIDGVVTVEIARDGAAVVYGEQGLVKRARSIH